MTESERARKTKRLIESLEALSLACKQTSSIAGELGDILREDIKDGEVHDQGKTPEHQ